MTEFNKFRIILMIIMGIILVISATQLEYSDLSFKTNWRSYLSIFSGLLIIMSLYLSIKFESKKKKIY